MMRSFDERFSEYCLVCIIKQEKKDSKSFYSPFIINAKGPSFIFKYKDGSVHEIKWGHPETYLPEE